jgi:hypothetical protein
MLQRRAARAGGPERELAGRRVALRAAAAQHGLAVAVGLSGLALMQARGWRFGYPEWLAAKLGLVAFLVLPLEAMHAYVGYAWIRVGLRETTGVPFSKTLQRGLGMEEMIRALAVPLLGIGVPLLAWLSLTKPF